MKARLAFAAILLAVGCADVPSATATDVVLETKHTSVFNKISYRIPKGWVVVDGESDWLAPNDDKQFWGVRFDRDTDPYYVVSVVFPYLTMQDMSQKHVRPLQEIAEATLHSLTIAANAKIDTQPEYFQIGDNKAVSFSTVMNGTHSHFQVFIGLADGKIATVAGNGPSNQLPTIRELVSAIAATVQPATQP